MTIIDSRHEERVAFDLTKGVADMRRGFRIQTGYGEIEIGSENAGPFADLAENLLINKLNDIEAESLKHVSARHRSRGAPVSLLATQTPQQSSSVRQCGENSAAIFSMDIFQKMQSARADRRSQRLDQHLQDFLQVHLPVDSKTGE